MQRSSLAISLLLVLLLAGCAQSPAVCPEIPYADLSTASTFADDESLPFQFPLDDSISELSPSYTHFCAGSSGPDSRRKHHAAEDYFQPAGTPVYAMADGKISFSGPMGGYGWLIIIDHPQANLYSLYGHLSPSRWHGEPGPVEKGDLIAYLGHAHENGGSLKIPLEPHLHLGIRAGQREDYPGHSAWRWMAGWIKPCPADLGWLQPSVIITSQKIPVGGFPRPAAGWLMIWWVEILLGGNYLIGSVCMLIFATRKNKPTLLAISGIVLLTAWWFFSNDGWKFSYALFAAGVVLLSVGLFRIIRRSRKKPHKQA